ncbi:MAG: hypothetical protein AAFR59_18360, partial [Bacteroidota bacterium]
MFTRFFACMASIGFCFMLFSASFAQNMDMNSSSPDAIQMMNDAMEAMGHDMILFEDKLHQAAETDPNMVVANYFQALDPEKSNE